MNLIRKLTVFAVCVASIAVFASCDEESSFADVTAAEAYSKALLKTSKALLKAATCENNFTETVNVVETVDNSTETNTYNIDRVFKFDGEKFYESNRYTQRGLTDDELWYVDGVIYELSDIYAIKYTDGYNRIEGLCRVELTSKVMPELSESVFDGVELTTEDCGAEFTVTVSGTEALNGGGYVAARLDRLGIGASDIELNDVTYTFLIDKNYVLQAIDFTYGYSEDYGSKLYKYTYSGTITISDIGSTSITAPAGDFEEGLDDWLIE